MNPQGDDVDVHLAHHVGPHHGQPAHGQGLPVPEYTALTPEQIDILAQHRAWLNANRQTAEGRKQGVLKDNWNKRDLRGLDLRWINARAANLRESNLAGAQLDNGDFRDAKLSSADFTDASVAGADFTAAVLKWAKLSQARGLQADSLGAADLSFCELPDSVKDFPALKSVEDVSSYLQGLYKIILTLCAVAVFTMLSFRDEQILEHHQAATAPIPIVGAAVSPTTFAAFVPIVILLFQVYFAIYVISLWTELSHLPAFFPDGTPLDRRAYQTLFNTFVRLHFNLLVERISDWISAIVSTFLSFYIPPAAIVCFWIAYLRRHEIRVTDLQAAVLAFSCFVAGVMTIVARPQIRNEWTEWWPLSVGRSLLLGAGVAAVSVLLATFVNAPAIWLALTVA
jgi:Pentapeptide repeats (8 copies)